MLAVRRRFALGKLAALLCALGCTVATADPEPPAESMVESPQAPCSQADICVPLRPAFADLHLGGEETYALLGSVYLQRDNQSAGRPLVVDGPGGPAALHTGGLSSATQPGFRLLYGRARGCDPGWEVGYLGVWGMFASDTATSANGTLQVAGPLGLQPGVLQAADVARSSYRSSLNSFEVNLFRRWCDGGPDRLAGEPWRRCGPYDRGTFDWLAGFRWAGLDETALLAFTPPGNRGAGLYGVESSSNIFAAQVGARSRMAWERWAFETWGKVAFGGSAMGQSQQPIYNSDITVAGEPLLERSARSSREGGVGFIGDLTFALTYRINETWGLRLGYNLLWLSGVALAPNQFDFSTPPGGGLELHGGSGVYLYGASLGGEARW
jgi:hypothetical protein